MTILMESAVFEETSGVGPSDGLRPSRVTKSDGLAGDFKPQVFPIRVLLFDQIDLVLTAVNLD